MLWRLYYHTLVVEAMRESNFRDEEIFSLRFLIEQVAGLTLWWNHIPEILLDHLLVMLCTAGVLKLLVHMRSENLSVMQGKNLGLLYVCWKMFVH